MNTQSYNATRLADGLANSDLKKIGDFSWHFLEGQSEPDGMRILLPADDESGEPIWAPVMKEPKPFQLRYEWDGNLDQPTLKEPVQLPGWHGRLISGRLESDQPVEEAARDLKICRPIEPLPGETGQDYMIFCPACQCGHRFPTGEGPGPRWKFNGNLESPTFEPSLRIQSVKPECHSQVTDGRIHFYPDSGHALAGQTVPLEAF